MNLNIEVDQTYYRSDLINNGRLAKSFFEKLTRNIFNHSYKYWKESSKLIKTPELPILFGERNIYSTVAVAIDAITPMHLSEWSFNTSDEETLETSKRLDFWCLNKEGENGKPINYLIELKSGWYNLNKRSNEDFHVTVRKDIEHLIKQTKTMKGISPNWGGFDDVYMGLSVIHGFHNKEEYYNAENVRDNIYQRIDKRLNAQLLFCTWTLPEDMDIGWEKDECRFVSIAGIILTKKRN